MGWEYKAILGCRIVHERNGKISTSELSGRVHPEKRTEYLRIQPGRFAEMISDFEQAFSDSLTGLLLNNLELRLNVAVDTEEDRTVLLVPPAFKGKMRSDSLNGFIVRVFAFRRDGHGLNYVLNYSRNAPVKRTYKSPRQSRILLDHVNKGRRLMGSLYLLT